MHAVVESNVMVATVWNTTESQRLFQQAQNLMPGGVNSPVRAFKAVGGQPIVFDRVQGAYAWDVDGNRYIDYVGTWGPAICGHAHPEVIEAICTVARNGTSFGAPCRWENVLAEMVIAAVPSIEMVRFVNSGTEACMGALRLARAFTGREKIIKFEGCYHGHADMFLVKAGSGVATLGLPDSPGVPKSVTAATLTAPYNDLQAVADLFAQYPGEIAAVVLEPVVGNAGFILPEREFLVGLRELTQRDGALLVFDEVMTGFRIRYGGAQEYFGITPDLTTLGKIIGGGLPVGAYGGRKDIMLMVAPAGPMYQAGTLSGNPLAMMAGIKTLELLQRPGVYEHLERITSRLVQGLQAIADELGHPMCTGSLSGMFGFFFTQGPVKNYAQAKTSDVQKFSRFHRGMLERGIYLAPSQFEAGFTSLAHTEADIDQTLAAAREVLSALPR
jgi:glutamate-1-semialdehyde 2,1-aminomutase